MFKKIVLCLLVSFSLNTFSQNQNTVLWRISGKNLTQPSYVYGTIHIKDKRVFNVNDSLLNFIQNCDDFACELHPDSLNALVFSSLTKKDTVADYFKNSLDSKEYDLINKKLQNDLGLTLNQIKNKNFKLLKLLLNPVKQKEDDYPTFLDGYLMAIAKRKNKVIIGLENIRSHEEGGNSIHSNDKFKEEVINLSKDEKSEDKFEKLIKLYLSGNIDQIQENTSLLSYEAQHDLIYIRNKRMAHTIDSIIKNKTLFATCGAAHLGGDNGIIQLLKEMGYTLTPIYSDKKTYLSLSNLPQNFNSWQTISNNDLGFTCQLPGMPATYFKNIVYSDMQMYIDIGSGCSYVIFPISSAIDISDKQKVYDKFVESLKNRAYGQTLKQNKPITYNGFDGIEVEYQSSRKISVRGRVFIENNILYTFFITYPSNINSNEEFNHFFNSISLYKPIKNNIYVYTNKLWNIELDLPIKPIEKKEYSHEGKTRIEVLSVKATDNVAGIHYLLECTEAGEGRYYTNDTLLLDGVRNSFKDNKHLVSMEDSLFTYQGSRCKQTIVYFDDQSSSVNWTMLRGFKWYNFMAIMSKSVLDKHLHDAIFKSIKFNATTTDDFITIKTPVDSSLTIKLAQEFKKSPADSDEGDVEEDKNPLYRSFDSKTGITYYLQKHEESSYYYNTTDSLYWKKIEGDLVNYNDTLLSVKNADLKNLNAKEFIVKPKESTIVTHYLIFNFGKYRYNFYTYLPEGEVNERNLFPFKNIAYFGNHKNEIVSDTSAFRKLITDAFATDTIVKDKSRSSFYSFKLTNNMFGQIKEVLNSPNYTVDTTRGYSFDIKSRLINNLDDLNSNLIYEFVKSKLNDPKTEKDNLPEYSRVLATIKTKEAYEELNKFLKSQISNLNQYSTTFYKIQDSLNLAMILFPTVLDAFEKDTVENYSLANVTKILLDTGLLKYDFVKPYEAKLLQQSLSYQSQKTNMKSIFETYYNDVFISILNYSPNKEIIYDHFNQLCKSKNSWCAYYGSYYLLKNNQLVSKKLTESLAEHPYIRNYLCTDYKKMNRLNEFPAKYKNQLNFAEADLYTHVYDMEEMELTKMDFIKKKQIHYKGKDAEFYLFKVSYSDNEGTYLAFAGPYYVGEELNNSGDKTGIYYDIEYIKGLEEDCLEKYLEVK